MGFASDTLARIDREQWEDYKQRFVPLEEELIDAYDNPELKAERLKAVTQEATSASDNAQGVAKRSLARYGQSMTGKGDLRAAELSKVSSIVDAQNNNRAQMAERDRLLLSGGLTSRGV